MIIKETPNSANGLMIMRKFVGLQHNVLKFLRSIVTIQLPE